MPTALDVRPPGEGGVALHTYSTTLVNYDSQSHPLNSSQMPSTVERERIHYRIAVMYFARQVRISQSLWLRPSPSPTHPHTHLGSTLTGWSSADGKALLNQGLAPPTVRWGNINNSILCVCQKHIITTATNPLLSGDQRLLLSSKAFTRTRLDNTSVTHIN